MIIWTALLYYLKYDSMFGAVDVPRSTTPLQKILKCFKPSASLSRACWKSGGRGSSMSMGAAVMGCSKAMEKGVQGNPLDGQAGRSCASSDQAGG